MDDLISRQDAIEEFAKRDTTDGTIKVFSGREIREVLKEREAASFIRCESCRFFFPELWHCDRFDHRVGADDFCSYGSKRTWHLTKEEAIRLLRNAAWLGTNEDREQTSDAVRIAIRCLEREEDILPWAEEEQGEWVENKDDNGTYYTCSMCGHPLPRFVYYEDGFTVRKVASFDRTPFCPHCGAAMIGGENETN